jgi:hypothetical protein
LTDRLLARLARREWTVTVEVVTPAPSDHASRARITTLADAVRAEDETVDGEAERLDTTLGADWRDVWRETVGIA